MTKVKGKCWRIEMKFFFPPLSCNVVDLDYVHIKEEGVGVEMDCSWLLGALFSLQVFSSLMLARPGISCSWQPE